VNVDVRHVVLATSLKSMCPRVLFVILCGWVGVFDMSYVVSFECVCVCVCVCVCIGYVILCLDILYLLGECVLVMPHFHG